MKLFLIKLLFFLLNKLMAKRISQFDQASTPLSGGETVILNQNGSTYITTLSVIKDYTGGGGGSDVSGLSANWENTYTNYSTNSSNFAKVTTSNSFSGNQKIIASNARLYLEDTNGDELDVRTTGIYSTSYNGYIDFEEQSIVFGGQYKSQNWDNITTDYISNSSNFAKLNTSNLFSGNLSAHSFNLSGNDVIYKNVDSKSIFLTDFESITGNASSPSIVISNNNSSSLSSLSCVNHIHIGGFLFSDKFGDGVSIGNTVTPNNNGVVIGHGSGYFLSNNSIFIGNSAGFGGGGSGGLNKLILIGDNVGFGSTSSESVIIGCDSNSGSGLSASVVIGNRSCSSGFDQGNHNVIIGDGAGSTSFFALSGSMALGAGSKMYENNTLSIGSTDIPLLTSNSGTSTGNFLVVYINGVRVKLPIYV